MAKYEGLQMHSEFYKIILVYFNSHHNEVIM